MKRTVLRACVLLLAAGCSPDDGSPTPPPPPNQQAPKPREPEPKPDEPAAKKAIPDPSDPSMSARAPDEFRVKFVTSRGDFVVRVTRAWSPRGADRFHNLVKAGYYDGVRFFRVIGGFMAQFGISGDPVVSARWSEASILDDPVKASNTRGRITYAKTGRPDSRSTQLFINFGDNSRLDGDGFAPFGEVTEGMDVVDRLFSGYGEGPPRGRGPDQGRIVAEGNAYLDARFRDLDTIKTARIIE